MIVRVAGFTDRGIEGVVDLVTQVRQLSDQVLVLLLSYTTGHSYKLV